MKREAENVENVLSARIGASAVVADEIAVAVVAVFAKDAVTPGNLLKPGVVFSKADQTSKFRTIAFRF
jgi:hypothetical protein